MLRNIALSLVAVVHFGWLQQAASPPSDAARRDDVYSIYSALLTGTGNDSTMMIAAQTVNSSLDLQKCVNLPSEYQSRWNELLVEYNRDKNIPDTIEPALKIPKDYLVLSPIETSEFTSSWNRVPGKPQNPKFQGARQLFFLGRVYFSLDRTLALTSISMGCGSLCGTSGWRVFEKNRDGSWVLMGRRAGTVTCGDSGS